MRKFHLGYRQIAFVILVVTGTQAIGQTDQNVTPSDEGFRRYDTLPSMKGVANPSDNPISNDARTDADVSVLVIERAVQRLRSFKPKDQFDVGPKFPELVGRTFTIDIAPRNGVGINHSCNGSPEYYFDASASELSLTYGDGARINDYTGILGIVGNFEDRAAKYDFECHVSWGPRYLGSNAFGLTVPVDVKTENLIAIATPLSGYETAWVNWRKHMAPDQARIFAKSLRLRVSGTIGQWLPDQPVLCGTHIDPPTIDSPTERIQKGCLVKATINRIDVIDVLSGEAIPSDSN